MFFFNLVLWDKYKTYYARKSDSSYALFKCNLSHRTVHNMKSKDCLSIQMLNAIVVDVIYN
jgi:hypothetical protein